MAHRLRQVVLSIVGLLAFAAVASAAPERPRLVVLISIDQFRADYLTRFYDLFQPAGTSEKPGGFRYLMERGAYHTDAHHDHYPLFTGPGHSILLTGAPPYKSGIVGNDWFDRKENKKRYCVRDWSEKGLLVGARAEDTKPDTGVSPATLRVTTVGDELKMATGRQSKVWAVALKDRAAILMAGHLADGVLWFDENTGNWISSRYYRDDGTLPDWIVQWNKSENEWIQRMTARDVSKRMVWKLSVPKEKLSRLWTPANNFAKPRNGITKAFDTEGIHHLQLEEGDPKVYYALTRSPFGNQYVFDTAETIVRHEQLGRDKIPDLMAINLSSNDYVGHLFGPDSAEVLDITVQTDRQLSRFFRFLNGYVRGGLKNVAIVVTADHGVAPIPNEAEAAGMQAGIRGTGDDTTLEEFKKILEQTLTGMRCDEIENARAESTASNQVPASSRPSPAKILVEDQLYFDMDALKTRNLDTRHVEEAAASAFRCMPGIYAAYSRSQILEGRLPKTDIARRISRSFHPAVGGDIVLVEDPYWVPDSYYPATHGTPYAYDTSVPLLLAGTGVKPGRYTERVSTLDIAPTLSYLLGVLQPSGCEGHVLSKAVK